MRARDANSQKAFVEARPAVARCLMNRASSATTGDDRLMYQPSARFMKYKRRAHWPVITLLASCGFFSHCFGQVNTPTADHEPNTPSALPTVSGAADLSDKGLPADPSAGSADDPQKSASGQNTKTPQPAFP